MSNSNSQKNQIKDPNLFDENDSKVQASAKLGKLSGNKVSKDYESGTEIQSE